MHRKGSLTWETHGPTALVSPTLASRMVELILFSGFVYCQSHSVSVEGGVVFKLPALNTLKISAERISPS